MESPTSISAGGALLWMVHQLLMETWVLESISATGNKDEECKDIEIIREQLQDSNTFKDSKKMHLTVQYTPRKDLNNTVNVRGLIVRGKVFIHFISKDINTRLDLLVKEYVKAETDGPKHQKDELVDIWICRKEILRWRLDRNIFPKFEASDGNEEKGLSRYCHDAELSQLSDPIIIIIAEFMGGIDFCRLTQTNRELNRLANYSLLWEKYTKEDFPHRYHDSSRGWKRCYVGCYIEAQRIEIEESQTHTCGLELEANTSRGLWSRQATPLAFALPLPRIGGNSTYLPDMSIQSDLEITPLFLDPYSTSSTMVPFPVGPNYQITGTSAHANARRSQCRHYSHFFHG